MFTEMPTRLEYTRILALEHKQIPEDGFHYVTVVLDVIDTPFIHELHFTTTEPDTIALMVIMSWKRFDDTLGEWYAAQGFAKPSPVSPPSPEDDDIPF